MTRVLIVEDEAAISRLLRYNLEKEGYEVSEANNGDDGLKLALTGKFDMILLDLMLPGVDGLEITKELKKSGVDTPIIMLTAKDSELDKILGLELGADDYMTKPFSPREVIARIKSVLRRYRKSRDERTTSDLLTFGELVIDPRRFQVTLAGEVVDFTPKEFELLFYLARHPGQVFSREQLLDAVWGYSFSGETRLVDVHISHLREKIEKDTKEPKYLVTVRGFGYTFEGDV